MSIKITIHGIQPEGTDSLTGKTTETITVSIEDGTVTESPLSIRSLMQIVRMKLRAQPIKVAPAAAAAKPVQAIPIPLGNGPTVK